MKTSRLWVGLILLSSCSTPRYTYYFDHQHPVPSRVSIDTTPRMILVPDRVELSASNGEVLSATAGKLKTRRSWQARVQGPRWDSALVTREPQDIFLQPASSGSSRMEPDLKRSIIFVMAGIVALIIGGQVFWVLGSLSLLIGLIFGVKWLLRQ